MPQNELLCTYYVCNHNNIRAFLFIKDKLVGVDTFLKKKLKASNTAFASNFHFDAFIFMQIKEFHFIRTSN